MRTAMIGLALVVLATAPVRAEAEQSCSAHRAVCEASCTPGHVARYHAGLTLRCTSSGEPRWSECLRTGIWADLERRSTGWWEDAARN